MEFEVSEANAPDSGEAETTADENAEAKEDQALAGADSSDEEEINEEQNRSEVDKVLAQVGTGELDAYDVMSSPKGPAQAEASEIIQDMYNDVSIDNGLHPDDDFDKILDIVADQLASDYGTDGALNEWANDAGYQGSENMKDNTFEQDIEFMTRVISGGLNGPKKDQTTLPHTRVKVEESRQVINEWKKLSGIK
jgi:hypothetical protein